MKEKVRKKEKKDCWQGGYYFVMGCLVQVGPKMLGSKRYVRVAETDAGPGNHSRSGLGARVFVLLLECKKVRILFYTIAREEGV